MPPKRPSCLAVFVGRITRGFAIDCFRKKHAAKRPDAHRADVCSEIDEKNEIAFDFGFTVTNEELAWNTLEMSYDKTFPLGEGMELKIKELVIAGLPSIECDWMELRLYHYWAVSEEEQEPIDVVDGEEIMAEIDGQPLNQVYLGEKFRLAVNRGEPED